MELLSLTVTDGAPTDVPGVEGRLRLCEYLAKGFEGDSFCFPADAVACPLGRFNLGVGPTDDRHRRKLAKLLVRWGDIGTEEASRAYIDRLPTLRLAGRWLAVRSADTGADADLVVARGRPDEIMGLVQRHTRCTGHTLRCEIGGIGASCGEIVGAALTRGEPVISLGCDGTRRHGRLPDTCLLWAAPGDVYARLG